MIFLSLKTYKEATGGAVIKLLSSVKQVSQETNVKIIPVAQPTDIYRIKKELDIEVWGQHIDPIDPGRHMGWISPYSIKEAGASGVVINHAEHELDEEKIIETIKKAKQYNLKTLVLTQTVNLALKIENYSPDFIGYEKKDFIETGMSMIESEKENIKLLANKLKTPLIIGAGITNKDDIEKSLFLGAKGIILASAFIKAENQKEKLRELAMGFKK